MTTKYDDDFSLWAQEQAAAVRAGQWDAVDRDHLVEEIEAMGRSDRKELRSRLAVLWAHLLKWEFQPTRRGTSWEATIFEQRVSIQTVLEDSPSLRPYLSDPAWLDRAWQLARAEASKETGFQMSTFPEHLLWSVEQTLDPGFKP